MNQPTFTPAPRRVRRKRKTVESSTPVVNIQGVLQGDFSADWTFDSAIVSVVDVGPLRINGASPTEVLLVAGVVLRVGYDIAIDVGDPWTYDGTPVATFANGGTLQPGSGVTLEG